jgi:hypothetical protein
MMIQAHSLPNQRLKLPGPAFRGSVRLCTSRQIPQHGALPPAGARPAAQARSVRQRARRSNP